MAWAAVQYNRFAGTSSPLAVNYTTAPTSGNLLVATVFGSANAAITISGWTSQRETTSTARTAILSKISDGTEGTGSFNVTTTGSTNIKCHLYELSGNEAAGATDGTNGSTSGGSGTTLTSGSVATTDATDLIICAFGLRGNVTSPTVDSSFVNNPTTMPTPPTIGGVTDSANIRLFDGILVPGATGTYSTTANWTSAQNSLSAIVAFKGASGNTTTTQTITGVSRITKTVAQTITGVARITKTVAQVITGKARIIVTTPQTVTGKSRIQVTTSRTITGVANIVSGGATTQTITGVSRITATTTRTETGVARIQKAVTRTITGLSRIMKVVGQTITGKARITVVATQTITGKGRITATTTRTITGVAKIVAAGGGGSYFQNDTLFKDLGNGYFIPIEPITMPVWNTAGRPSAPRLGAYGFNTTTGAIEVYTSGGWI